jgi:hypothetical protein
MQEFVDCIHKAVDCIDNSVDAIHGLVEPSDKRANARLFRCDPERGGVCWARA